MVMDEFPSKTLMAGTYRTRTPDGMIGGGRMEVERTAEDRMAVRFFDTDGTDNGLYVYSGTANYESGDVTAINTNPTGSSAMGGKHTIVKVTAGKGHEIALSDINFV